ncbi:hypothetical protein QBB31_14110 [Streptomyces scabiei]|uniref:hypothetical protein n=1 Tax=Streptomyces scabiei TaxID=1930 RepID=UPI002FF1EBB5
MERVLNLSKMGPVILLTGYQTPTAIRRSRARSGTWLKNRKVKNAAALAETAVEATRAQHTALPGKTIAAAIAARIAKGVLALDEEMAQVASASFWPSTGKSRDRRCWRLGLDGSINRIASAMGYSLHVPGVAFAQYEDLGQGHQTGPAEQRGKPPHVFCHVHTRAEHRHADDYSCAKAHHSERVLAPISGRAGIKFCGRFGVCSDPLCGFALQLQLPEPDLVLPLELRLQCLESNLELLGPAKRRSPLHGDL